MANLRIVSINVEDSTTITAKFTEKLSRNINTSNITLVSQLDNIPSPDVLKVEILNEVLTITTQPLTPIAAYFIIFESSDTIPFNSLNGNSILYEDGVTNKQLILGPPEDDNVVQEFLINYLRKNIFEITDTSTLVNKIVQGLSIFFSKSLYDIKQLKNENYISFTITDEEHVRGSGPFDRLNEEGAYEILRIGKTPTGTASSLTFSFTEFPIYPVTLQAEEFEENIKPSSKNTISTFNINNFIITTTKQNVIKLKSAIFIYNDIRPNFIYNIESLGYQILSSRYDQDFGFSYLTLENNQFKLSETILNDANFSTQNIASVEIIYEYKNLGRYIDANSIVANTVLTSIREVLPPIINVFNLKHAPITDVQGNVLKTGGIIFTDPNSFGSSKPHSAFLYEIPYNLSALPTKQGEYSIDYTSGTVYVFGASTTNDGTGALPPLATYYYEYLYKSNVDYVYDFDFGDIVALPFGSLINNSGKVTFDFEEVLFPKIDYKANVHVEELSERIDNRLLALNSFKTLKSPITNVFRIFNETSGEIYNTVRWSNDKVYFSYNTPPSIAESIAERVSFTNILNEILFVNNKLTNASSINIFKCLLDNNNLVSATEDCLASIFNTPVKFSNTSIFKNEKWFDSKDDENSNINRLTSVGEYQIDYANGIVYCAIETSQSLEIGTVSYKSSAIVTQFPHLISVEDIYYRISLSNPKDKVFTYSSFRNGFIYPFSFDSSDEGYFNSNLSSAYLLFSGQIGAFIDTDFIPGVANNIKFLRGIYVFDDLKYNSSPLNFAVDSTFNGSVIDVSPISKQEYGIVLHNISDGYYIDLNTDLSYLSNSILFTFSVIRNSDSQELWDNSGIVVAGSPIRLKLSGVNSPNVGDAVVINYSFEIIDLSRVIVDYNKGDYFVDYSYLVDEIIVSYEYGENLIDFRKTRSISNNDIYYVTYKVGALRDGLLKNFGTLINVPELTNFNIDLERERYRDAISAALESFIQGPTVAAIENIVEKISHIKPEIIESVFQSWSLGSSLLTPRSFETTGEFKVIPAKYGNGVLVNSIDQSIVLPASSNIKFENGTFESWIIPEWNGIDNNVDLKINILKDGYALSSNKIFIGAGEFHPDYDTTNSFTINKLGNVSGIPNTNKDGVFIYYDNDHSNLFKRWYFIVKDGYGDGYVNRNYSVIINSPGLFYDVKSTIFPKPSNLSITSNNNKISFIINDTAKFNEGLTFIADREYYLLDFGEDNNKNRLSIYKDPSGYINFRVYDKFSNVYSVSGNVSSWKAHEKHHVAASWTLNSKNNRDELHLFFDGFEVPNIIKYGSKIGSYLHEKFRTINPEEIAGVISKNIVSSIDLVITTGSNTVSSSINFSSYGISNGDIIIINEVGFDPDGYVISNVNGNILTLSANMPQTLANGRFTINRTRLNVATEINVYPNIAVSTISPLIIGNDLIITSGSDIVSSPSINFETQDVIAGNLLRIDGYAFEKHYVVLDVSDGYLTVNDLMPLSISNAAFYIYPSNDTEIPGVRALRPSYSLSQDGYDGYVNNVLVLNNNVAINDLILIKTLGVNHKRIKQKYYQWGNASNIIQTMLPPPISLDSVAIYHTLLSTLTIKASPLDGYNSTVSLGIFTSNSFITEQPSNSTNGRTLEISISTNNNLDFTTPTIISISGLVNAILTTESVSFSNAGSKNTINKFSTITGVVASGKPINTSKVFMTLSVREAYSITIPENSTTYPVVRYSYQTNAGNTLSCVGATELTDVNGFFSSQDVGNYLVITAPVAAVGTYQIISVSNDRKSITIATSLPVFVNGYYQILNSSTFRSGFQNGFFLLEDANIPLQPYNLKKGTYEFDFYTYLSIKLDPINTHVYFGSDRHARAHINAVLDEVVITASKLTDTRVGEIVKNNQQSITKDFNSVKALNSNINTLVLAHFDTFPFINDATYYVSTKNKNIIQSGYTLNDNFYDSMYLTNKPYIIENAGILDTRSEGTIEFWANPIFDTGNDPNYRFYFDAAGTFIETVASLNDSTVQTSGRISRVISVKSANGDNKIDYFAGGTLETSSQGAVSEAVNSINNSTLEVANNILQVITVKIINDPTNTDYFQNGTIGTNKRTIYLGRALPANVLNLIVIYKLEEGGDKTLNTQVIRLNKRLPNQQTKVVVTYIPSGLQGDRISIFKDQEGFINFVITASGTDYAVRAPILWQKNSWHRLKATFKVNAGKSKDEIRLFIDGYESGNKLFGTGLISGSPTVFGASSVGSGSINTNIKIKDFLNELYIGGDFSGKFGAYALINNFRVSNVARPIFAPFGESIDVNYNSNVDAALPVTKDLYTTLLLDFKSLLVKTTDFITLNNKKSGIFNFSVNILDSFGIINGSQNVKEVLEALIKVLKPANSRVFLKYIK